MVNSSPWYSIGRALIQQCNNVHSASSKGNRSFYNKERVRFKPYLFNHINSLRVNSSSFAVLVGLWHSLFTKFINNFTRVDKGKEKAEESDFVVNNQPIINNDTELNKFIKNFVATRGLKWWPTLAVSSSVPYKPTDEDFQNFCTEVRSVLREEYDRLSARNEKPNLENLMEQFCQSNAIPPLINTQEISF